MSSDYGINISTPGVNVSSATGSQLLLTSKYPFMKLDTQTITSFQTIFLLFNTDPPEPPVGIVPTITTVYTFVHGYTYTPRVWALFQVVSPTPLTNFYQAYFQEAGIIAAKSVGDFATMYIAADQTNVYIKVNKYYELGIGTNDLRGLSLNITIFTFVDDLTTN